MTYNQNYYYVKNPVKWGGVDKVLYLSGWEYRLIVKLDENPTVTKCTANTFSIPYQYELDGRNHKYFIDFYVEAVKNNKISKVLIEVKPDAEVYPPKKPKINNNKALVNYNKRIATYIKNQNKWKFANVFGLTNGMTFVIRTEKACYVFINNVLTKISSDKYF